MPVRVWPGAADRVECHLRELRTRGKMAVPSTKRATGLVKRPVPFLFLAFPSECFSDSGECRAPMGLHVAHPLPLQEEELEFDLSRGHRCLNALGRYGARSAHPCAYLEV